MESTFEEPPFDVSVPHSARVTNYWLGGKDWYPADRAMAEQVMESFPEIVACARADRAFLIRVVTHLARSGVRQFLDLGTGLPTAGNTHEIAQSVAPDSRIVYVDNDPLVLVHARALLTGTPEGATAYVDSDIRDTAAVLGQAAATLDLDRPVAVTILGTLLHIDDDDEARALVRGYMDALASGSYLALADNTDTSEGIIEAARRWNAQADVPVRLRSPEQLARFFDGLELQEPGVVPVPEWRPDPVEVGTPQNVDAYCGLARKP